jgi:thiamine transport system substrate-binding protein
LNQYKNFVPYDWAVISFVKRKDQNFNIASIRDLLKPELKGKIALQDPRTSSPGLQFVMWVANTFPEDQAVDFLKLMSKQVHSFSPSWSASYGLFKNKNADVVLSYNTSPLYHVVEEKDNNYQSLEFVEAHPIQVEFAGVLNTCTSCEAAVKFIYFLRTPAAQKIIMNKNYMLPIEKQALEGTVFDTLPLYDLLDFTWPTKDELNKWLRLWSDISKDAS